MFEDLTTLDEVTGFVEHGYHGATGSPSWRSEGGPLPLAVAEPGPLMELAVMLAGHDGLTRQQLGEVFAALGAERFDRGIATMRAAGHEQETKERRPNSAGCQQVQVVFRCAADGR